MNYIDDWLILSVASVGSSASRCHSRPHERVCKECAFSTKDHFLSVALDSTSMQTHLSPARVESILSAVKSIRLGQSLTVRQFQRLLGLWQQHAAWYLLDCCTWDPCSGDSGPKGSPRGNHFLMIKVTRRCLRALVMWKKPWFLI